VNLIPNTTAGSPISLLRPYIGRLAGLFSLILMSALAEAAGLLLLSIFLNVLVGAGGGTQRAVVLSSLYAYVEHNPSVFLLTVAFTYVGKALIALWATYVSFVLAFRMTDDWQMSLISGYLRAPLRRIEKRQGDMLQVILDEPSWVSAGLSAAGVLAQNAFSALTVCIVLLAISPAMTLGLTVIAVGAGAMIVGLSRYSRAIAAKRSQAYGDGYAYLTEMLGAIKQFRVFGLEEQAERRAASNLAQMRDLSLKVNVAGSSPRLLIELVFLAGFAAILLFLLPSLGEASVMSSIGLAFAAALRLLPSFSATAGTWVQVQQAMPAMHKIYTEMRHLEEAAETEAVAPRSSRAFHDRIVVWDVHFAYPGREQALAGVNLEVPRGSFTAIVGPSGSGKSTLVDLLCGFYRPDRGVITVDGVDLTKLDIRGWRRQLGVVAQDSFLLSGTVRENLVLLRPDCPEDLLRNVLRLVGADQCLLDCPDGLETRVGERGLTLSGGQRQRLALARALVREPAVLILDEATSALDVESEEVIKEGLDRLRGTVTLVVIAHRLSTVRQADRVYVLDRGKVVESGRHEALLRHGGLYAAMHRTAEVGLGK